jgi:eukaryotic-like serine/threonine-protein kinase
MSESAALGQYTHGFLFADLRGFTAHSEAHGDAAAADLLDRYRAVVRGVVSNLGGAEIKTEGDSFYIVFQSASHAVAAGLAIVAAAARASDEDPSQPIRVGIGIHAGEAEERPEGYVGTAVNLAARVCTQASVGEVLVTDTVRSLTRTSGHYRFTARGHPTLKGIAEPIALYRVEPAQSATTVAPSLGRPTIQRRALLAGGLAFAVVAVIAAAVLSNRGPLGTGTSPGGSERSPLPSHSSAVTTAPALASSSVSPGLSPTPSASKPSPTPSLPPPVALELLWERSGPTQPTPCCQTWWPAVNPKTGDIWVADSFADQYWIFTPDGEYLESWGTPGSAPRQLDFSAHRGSPQAAGGIAFAPDGSFYVADVGNRRIQKFDAKRRFVKQWGSFGSGDGQFAEPFGIVTDGRTVYVADDDRGDVQAFNLDGRFLRKFGRITTERGIFIGLDGAGFLYRSGEDGASKITKYDSTGRIEAELEVPGEAGTEVGGLAIDRNGHIFANIRRSGSAGLVELDSNGTELRAWSSGGETIALSPAGDAVYQASDRTTGWSTASLRKYSLPPPSSLVMYHGGPDRSGTMPGPGPAGDPAIAWDVPVTGGMPSSIMPLVAQGRVIVADTSGILTALDEATGTKVWSVDLGSATRSSPALVNDRVIAASDAGNLVAVSTADGSLIWRTELGTGAISASLLVADEALYVGSENGYLYKVDPSTGNTIWSVSVGGPITRGPAFSDGVLYVGATGGRFSAIDAGTHQLRWSVELGPGEVGTPEVGGGRVYVSRGLQASAPPHDLVALDIRDGSFLWSFASPTGQQVYMAGLADGLVFAVSEDDNVYALDAATGVQRWIAQTGGIVGTPVGLVGDMLYVGSADQTVRALDTASGEQQWRVDVSGTPTIPAVIDGRVIVGTSLGRVVAILGSP